MDWRLVLDRDRRGMTDWYPQFTLHLPSPWSAAGFRHRRFWRGWVPALGARAYEIVLDYRPHPSAYPIAWVVQPEISRRTWFDHPHLNPDGSVCAHFLPDRSFDRQRHDLHMLMHLIVVWLNCHVVFSELSYWPGPEAPHDPVTILDEVLPTAPCPCGSGDRFSLCCRPGYVRYQKRRVGPLHVVTQIDFRTEIRETLRSIRRELGPRAAAERYPNLGPPAIYLPDRS